MVKCIDGVLSSEKEDKKEEDKSSSKYEKVEQLMGGLRRRRGRQVLLGEHQLIVNLQVILDVNRL